MRVPCTDDQRRARLQVAAHYSTISLQYKNAVVGFEEYRGVDRKRRFAWVRALAKARRIIEMDLPNNNSQIYDHGSTRAL
jgi:hypothetical protein